MSEKKINEDTDWNDLLESINNKKFKDEYPSYLYKIKEEGYLLVPECKIGEKNIFIFENQRKIRIKYIKKAKEKGKEYTFTAWSSLQIDKYLNLNNIKSEYLFFKGGNIKYINSIDDLTFYLNDSDNELEIIENDPLPILEYKKSLSSNKDYKPEEYSKYFFDYFKYEDEAKKNEIFIFQKNEARRLINNNLMSLRRNKDIKIFKLTGPTSIGKSLTLFRACHVLVNFIYINLRVLNENKNNIFKCYSIIISELERLDIDENIKDLNKVINENYNNNNSYLDLLINIMEFLKKKKDQLKLSNYIFVFDQFKMKYIKDGFIEKIQKYENIKIVLCSSINDKNMRTECIKTWSEIGVNIQQLNKDNQNYYIYFSSIYKCEKEIDNNDIIKKLGYLPKYKKLYKKKHKNETDKSFLKDVKEKIIIKINDFCKNNNLEQSEVLIKLKYILNKNYEYEHFNSILKYIPLKYCFIYFTKYDFIIKPMFPYLYNIIRVNLTEKECDNYFKNEEYKQNIIEGESVKGYYFEESVKFGLKNLISPSNSIKKYTLKDIVSMDKIINEEDEILESDYYDEENNSKEEINKYIGEIFNENEEKKFNENKKIKLKEDNKNNENDSKIKMEKKVIKEEYKNINEDTIIDDTEIEEEGEELGDNWEEEEEEEEGQKRELDERERRKKKEENKAEKNEKRKNDENDNDLFRILQKFKIEEKKETIIEGLSENTSFFSKTIDDYRQMEIDEQIKEKQNIENSQLDGNESLLLDQFSKTGRTLDYAYMYGKKYSKTFIGFQIKCYFQNSKLKIDTIDKSIIKNKCKKILVNSMKLFNCKITKWHYFLIFYYNKKFKNENINNYNIIKCKYKGIAYLFYDPISKKFYKTNTPKKNQKEIDCLRINKLSNLDLYITNAKKYYENHNKIFIERGKINIGKNINNMIDEFIKDLSVICQSKEKPELSDILSQIKQNMNVIYSLNFCVQIPFTCHLISAPNDKYVFIYKAKKDKNFIAVDKKRDNLIYYDLSEKKQISNFYDCFDENCQYFYCLSKIYRRNAENLPNQGKNKDNNN